MSLSDSAAEALCSVAEKAMIARGVDPEIAREFAERACRPTVRRRARRVEKGVKSKARKAGKKMTRKTQLAINKGRKTAGLKPIKWKKKGTK